MTLPMDSQWMQTTPAATVGTVHRHHYTESDAMHTNTYCQVLIILHSTNGSIGIIHLLIVFVIWYLNVAFRCWTNVCASMCCAYTKIASSYCRKTHGFNFENFVYNIYVCTYYNIIGQKYMWNKYALHFIVFFFL